MHAVISRKSTKRIETELVNKREVREKRNNKTGGTNRKRKRLREQTEIRVRLPKP